MCIHLHIVTTAGRYPSPGCLSKPLNIPTEYCGMQLLMPGWDTCVGHQRPRVFSFIFNQPSFLTPTFSCILIHHQSPILSDTNVLMYSHSSSIIHLFWHQRPHVFWFIVSPHPFWHQRPHVFSFIFNHPSFLTPTSSCILIHLQSPILSDTNVLTYSHSFSITHPFWHQRPHVFSFIFNHPSFLTPTSSCILIHFQSPILSDTNVLMYSHSSSITNPFWHQRPHVFSFIFNHPSFLTPTSSCILIHFQSPILSDTNALTYYHSSSMTHSFWHQRPHVFSFIINHPPQRQTASTITYFLPNPNKTKQPKIFPLVIDGYCFYINIDIKHMPTSILISLCSIIFHVTSNCHT